MSPGPDTEGRVYTPETDLDYDSDIMYFLRNREGVDENNYPFDAFTEEYYRYRDRLRHRLVSVFRQGDFHMTYVGSGRRFHAYSVDDLGSDEQIVIKFLIPMEGENPRPLGMRFRIYQSEHARAASCFETLVPHSEFVSVDRRDLRHFHAGVSPEHRTSHHIMISEFVPGGPLSIAAGEGYLSTDQLQDFIYRYDYMAETTGRVIGCVDTSSDNVKVSKETGRIGVVDTNHQLRLADGHRNGFLHRECGGKNPFRPQLQQLLESIQQGG